jgi:hypothetical protein
MACSGTALALKMVTVNSMGSIKIVLSTNEAVKTEVRSTSRALCHTQGVGALFGGRVEQNRDSGCAVMHLSAVHLVCAPRLGLRLLHTSDPPPPFVSCVRAIQYSTTCHIRQTNQSTLHAIDEAP